MLVLGATMLLTVIGFASLVTARINTRMVVGTNDWAEAGALAIAGVELAPVMMDSDPNWRTTFASGVSIPYSLGGGTVRIVLIDESDGDFTSGLSDPVRAYGIGYVGDAVRVRSVLLRPNIDVPMSCLEVSVHSVDDFAVMFATFTTNQIVSTAGRVTGFAATLNGDVEAVDSGGGVNITGTETTGVPPRTVPDETAVFEYYVANGTPISIDALPVSGVPSINNAVLTPKFNSITGVVNALGIYVIDCKEQPINIGNSRIQGTLVLLDAPKGFGGVNCQVIDQVNWESAIPNYPALLVDGDLTLKFAGGGTMDEAALSVNFNPPGAPYLGDSDNAMDDTYPSLMDGLIYARGSLVFAGSTPTFKGVIVGGSGSFCSMSTAAAIEYSNRYYLDPPPGFGTGPYEPVFGSWRWDTLPCVTKNQPCTKDSDCCSNDCNQGSGKCKS